MRVRPAARRTRAFGSAIRVTATSRTSSKISTGGWLANGVPGIGIKQLIGTLSGAATNRHSALLHRSNCSEAILKRVCADNLAIKFRGGVDVVIVSGHSCGFEFARFQGSDFTERDTKFHTQLAHLANDLKHAVKFFRTVAHAAPP